MTVEVTKTYARDYAREVFGGMEPDAKEALAQALELSKNYEPADIPDSDGIEYDDFLREELIDAAREDVRADPNLYSFFVVSESKAGQTKDLYVVPDWPSAEAFAKRRLAEALTASH